MPLLARSDLYDVAKGLSHESKKTPTLSELKTDLFRLYSYRTLDLDCLKKTGSPRSRQRSRRNNSTPGSKVGQPNTVGTMHGGKTLGAMQVGKKSL